MLRRTVLLAVNVLALAGWGTTPTLAQPQTEPRIAFVVGNSAYRSGAVPLALNDAGLVAEALRSIGFDIVEGADLSQSDLLRSYREFLGKVEATGPETLAFVYFSGDGVSFEGENFLLGVDAKLVRDTDIPIEGVRLNDMLQSFANSPARAKVMMIDAARPIPFKPQGKPLARGLEAIDPPQGVLLAYSSAPGTVAPDRPSDYGAYATAIAEMLRAPGIDLDTAFTHIRSRAHMVSEGQQTPWHISAIAEPIELVPAAAATASTVPPPPPVRQARPMRDIGPEEAYALAIEADTLEGYVEFVEAYPGHPLTRRVWAMIRARREALAWMRALETNTPRAYWTYMRRYPRGMYLADAERRLRRLRQPFAPPPGFVMIDFDDVPMALAGEPVEYEEVYEVGPPPPRLVYAAPPPAYLAHLPPPRHRSAGAAAVLPALAVALPVMAALAPAPHRTFTPGTGPGARSGAFGRHRGARTTPASTAPAAAPTVAPTATAPTVSTPKTSTAPSVVTPSAGQNRPPGWQRGPGQGRTPPPGVARRTPPAAPTPSAPSAAPNSAAPNPAVPTKPSNSTAPAAAAAPGNPAVVRPPTGHRGPPPGIANRTPPSTPGGASSTAAPNHQHPPPGPRPPGVSQSPPQHSVARPTPPAAPPAARPTPPRPPAPPAQAAAKPAPPKAPPPAPAKPAPKPVCPAGKTLQNGACK